MSHLLILFMHTNLVEKSTKCLGNFSTERAQWQKKEDKSQKIKINWNHWERNMVRKKINIFSKRLLFISGYIKIYYFTCKIVICADFNSLFSALCFFYVLFCLAGTAHTHGQTMYVPKRREGVSGCLMVIVRCWLLFTYTQRIENSVEDMGHGGMAKASIPYRHH